LAPFQSVHAAAKLNSQATLGARAKPFVGRRIRGNRLKPIRTIRSRGSGRRAPWFGRHLAHRNGGRRALLPFSLSQNSFVDNADA
jgi:hypothetical protein